MDMKYHDFFIIYNGSQQKIFAISNSLENEFIWAHSFQMASILSRKSQ